MTSAPNQVSQLTVRLDGADLVQRVSVLAERSPEIRDGLLGLIDAGEELFRINGGDGSASGAGDLVLRLEASDALRRLLATVGAGDV
jgi:hypothetical protein